MEPLIIKHKIRTVLYLIFVMLAIILAIKVWNYYSIGIIVGALVLILTTIASYKSIIRFDGNNLEIKWTSITKGRKAIIPDSEIEMILLSKSYIDIQRKEKNSFTMSLEHCNKKTKIKVYEFLAEYASYKNIALTKRY
jgi:hypothetical protein